MDVPDGIEPLLGYRQWVADRDKHGVPVLRSLYYPTAWPRQRAMSALCLRAPIDLWPRPDAPHPSPQAECVCGIYAWLAPPADAGARGPIVEGVIRGWGRYILGNTGWRAELARPTGLLVPRGMEAWADEAAGVYGLDLFRSWARAA